MPVAAAQYGWMPDLLEPLTIPPVEKFHHILTEATHLYPN